VEEDGGQRIREKGKEGGQEAEGDDEKADPGDKEEIGQKPNGRDPVEMEGDKGCCSQYGDGSGEKGKLRILQEALPPCRKDPTTGGFGGERSSFPFQPLKKWRDQIEDREDGEERELKGDIEEGRG
jgi:hypothetical protein